MRLIAVIVLDHSPSCKIEETSERSNASRGTLTRAETVHEMRRGIGGNKGKYVAEVIRLLSSTEGARDRSALWEVCRTDKSVWASIAARVT